MAKYIDAEKLQLEYYGLSIHGTMAVKAVLPVFVGLLEQQPIVDVAEVKHGEWKEVEIFDGDVVYQCSARGIEWVFTDGTPSENGTKYCPNCGAKMDGGEK